MPYCKDGYEEESVQEYIYQTKKPAPKGKGKKKKSERDEYLDTIEEDGASHAAMMEHAFQLTSHTAMSPMFRSAMNQAGTYLDRNIEKKEHIEDLLENAMIRTHFATLVEHELLESETSLRSYRDPTAQDQSLKKKIFAAFSIKGLLEK